MNRKRFLILLAVLGLVCAGVGALVPGGLLVLSGLPQSAVFPFGPIAKGLRALSLLGGAGNGAAWVLYLVFCLAPLAIFLKKRPGARHDLLIPLICLLLLGGMYLLINPGAAAKLPGSAALLTQLEGAPVGGVLWSVIMAWVALELLDRSSKPGAAPAMTRKLLHLLCIGNVAVTCLAQAALLAIGLTADGGLADKLMQLITHGASAVTGLLTVPLLLGAVDLLDAVSGGFDDKAVAAADTLAALAARVLKLTVLLRLGCHLMQLALCGLLTNSSWQLELPLTELAFALGALLLARYVRESKALRDENDLFV